VVFSRHRWGGVPKGTPPSRKGRGVMGLHAPAVSRFMSDSGLVRSHRATARQDGWIGRTKGFFVEQAEDCLVVSFEPGGRLPEAELLPMVDGYLDAYTKVLSVHFHVRRSGSVLVVCEHPVRHVGEG
jgi:hypothetical protein